MEIIELNKSQLLDMLLCENPCGFGGYGIVVAKGDKVYKIRYKDFIKTYMSGDESLLDDEVDIFLFADQDYGLYNPYNRLKDFERLSETKSNRLITGVLSYRGLFAGIEMNYLNGYISFWDALDSISKDELKDYLDKTLLLVNDLIEHDIAPRDIRGENVLINPLTKDVVLIDLDDIETVYGPYPNYLKEYPHHTDAVMRRFNEMKKGLTMRKENILTRTRNNTFTIS